MRESFELKAGLWAPGRHGKFSGRQVFQGKPHMFWVWFVAFLLFIGHKGSYAGTNTLVIPPDQADVFGDTGGGFLAGPTQYQLFYNRTNFADLKADRILILGLGFRVDDEPDTIDISIPRVSIWASTFEKPLAELSKNAYENWGRDRMAVFDAQRVRFRGRPNTADPSDFQFKILFDEPFEYDRRMGDLLLDFQTLGPYPREDSGFTDGDLRDDASMFKISIGPLGPRIVSAGDIIRISYIPLSFLTAALGETNISISFFAVKGASYSLEFRDDLTSAGDWRTITNIPPDASREVRVQVPRTGQTGYFRLRE